jgi:hypothetical protein
VALPEEDAGEQLQDKGEEDRPVEKGFEHARILAAKTTKPPGSLLPGGFYTYQSSVKKWGGLFHGGILGWVVKCGVVAGAMKFHDEVSV